MTTKQARGNSAWRWLKIASIILLLMVALFAAAVWHGLSKMVTRTGAELPITPAYLEAWQTTGYEFTPLRIYQATIRDNFHAEGTDLHIYQFDPREIGKVVSSLHAKWPRSTWDQVVSGGTGIINETGNFRDLVPRELLVPDQNTVDHFEVPERLLHFYLDPERGLLYSRSD